MNEKNSNILLYPVLLLSMTFFVFGPLDIYFQNTQDLWFGLYTAIGISLCSGLLWGISLIIIGRFLPLKLKKSYFLLLFGIGVAFYLQGSFLQKNYGLVDGSGVDWISYYSWSIINALIWVFCLIIPFLIYKFRPFNTIKLLKTVSLFLIGVQIFTLVFVFATTGWNKNKSFYASEKNILTVAPEKNVIIFILDGFDSSFMDIILRKYPEIRDEFNDFTYYSNMISKFPSTKYSFPYIATGIPYQNDIPYSQYISEIWNSSPLITTLIDDGYAIDAYSMGIFFDPDFSAIRNIVVDTPKVKSWRNFVIAYWRLSAMRYLPHFLKKYVWMRGDEFEALKEAEKRQYKPYNMYGDIDLYNRLLAENLTIEEGGLSNGFKIYHLQGAHGPFTYDENVNRLTENGDLLKHAIPQAKGALRIVAEYNTQLKKLGLYDDAIIIIMADHGIAGSYASLFMMKDSKKNKPFEINAAPTSHEDIAPTLLSRLTGKEMATLDKWKEGQERERKAFFYTWGGRRNAWETEYWEWEAMPELLFREPSWYQTYERSGLYLKSKEGLVHLPPPEYTLGYKILFEPENINEVVGFFDGIYSRGNKCKESLGYRSIFNAVLSEEPTHDLRVEIEFVGAYNGRQPVLFSINGQRLYETYIINDANLSIKFDIPKKLVKDRMLRLALDYPEASSPAREQDLPDPRVLAVVFKSMRISEITQ